MSLLPHLDISVNDGWALGVHGGHSRAGGIEHPQYLLGGQHCALQHGLEGTPCGDVCGVLCKCHNVPQSYVRTND